MSQTLSLRHGGDLRSAIDVYGGDQTQWLDLSTGISPWVYPAPHINSLTWRNLPSDQTELLNVASKYYQCSTNQIIATPGSQIAIRLIPLLYEAKQSIAIPEIGYQEHANSWHIAGHTVYRYRDQAALMRLIDEQTIENVVVINPNNPTGDYYDQAFLSEVADQISGTLFIDEAFSDLNMARSVTQSEAQPFTRSSAQNHNPANNRIVLKSIGKFFGLAGARIGFVIGELPVVGRLGQLLSPWGIAAPSMALATMALGDTKWQDEQHQRISKHAQTQNKLMTELADRIPDSRLVNQTLFFSLFAPCSSIEGLHKNLANQHIWTRLGDRFNSNAGQECNWLRLSLAGNEFHTLLSALKSTETHNFLSTLS